MCHVTINFFIDLKSVERGHSDGITENLKIDIFTAAF
jgi:hypothetical protein